MIIKIFAFLTLFLASAISRADGSTGNGVIRAVHFYLGHTGVLISHSYLIDPEACGSAAWIILSDTYPHYKDVYALLLAAKLSGQPVNITVSGCLQGYPSLRSVVLS